MANGEKLKALGRGKIRMNFTSGTGKTTSLLMTDVLFVPSFGTHLISVQKLTECGLRVNSSGSTCEIRSRDGRDQIAIGDLNGRLYEMRIQGQQANGSERKRQMY